MTGTLELLLLSLATAAISLTLSKGKIFEPLREKFSQRSKWLGLLITCTYCTSHWVAFALVAFYRPVPLQSGALLIDLFVSAFAIIATGTLFAWIIYRAYMRLNPSEEVRLLREALTKARERMIEQQKVIRTLQAAK
jgi:hypothetical protein